MPRLKELRFKRYEPGHLELVAIFRDASQTGIGVVAYLIKNDTGVRLSESGVRASANAHYRSYMSMHADPS